MANPAFANVSFIFPLQNDTVDKSLNKLTATLSGGAAISDEQYKFGDGSLHIPSGGMLSIADAAVINPLAGDFTVEFWMYYDYSGDIDIRFQKSADLLTAGNGYGVRFYSQYVGEVDLTFFRTSVYVNRTARGYIPLPSKLQQVHVAFVKQGTSGKLFFDGVGVSSFSLPVLVGSNTQPFTVSNTGADLFISDFRFSTEALYTEDFDPPTEEFPTDDETKRKVPDVSGKTGVEATALLAERDLVLDYFPPEYSATIDEGKIISQFPAVDAIVDEGSTVYVLLSLGKDSRVMPDLSGLDEAGAVLAIAGAGIPENMVVFTKDYTGRGVDGRVVTQKPPAGELVDINPISSFVVVSIAETVTDIGPFFIATEYDEASAQYVANSYLLGVPAPTVFPVKDAVFGGVFTLLNRTEVDWEYDWMWYWEEPDGTRSDILAGDINDLAITTVEVGKKVTFTVPARVDATIEAKFVLWAEVYKEDQVWGVIIPSPSQYAENSTAEVHGAKVVAEITGDCLSPAAECTLTFDFMLSGQEYNSSRQYAVTFVNKFGDEGKPSVISVDSDGRPKNITVHPYQQVVIYYNSNYVPFDYAVDKLRIYRTVTDSTGSSFRFVAEVDVTSVGPNQTLFVDDIYDDATQEGISTQYNDMPVNGLKGLVSMPGGFAAGFDGNTVFFSEPYQLHAWPARYAVGVDARVVGLGVAGNSLIILTDRTPYYASGVSPDAILVRKVDSELPCINSESIVTSAEGVYFNSLNGIAFVKETGFGYLTKASIAKDIWKGFRGLRPYGLIYNGYLVYSFTDEVVEEGDRGSLMFVDGESGEVSLAVGSDSWADYVPVLTHYVSPHGETDEASEKLYVSQKNSDTLMSWEGFFTENVTRKLEIDPDGYYPAKWGSKPFLTPPTVDYTSAQVIASAYPVEMTFTELEPATFDVIRETTYTVKNSAPFRLKSVRPGLCFSFSFSNLTATIYQCQLVSAVREYK